MWLKGVNKTKWSSSFLISIGGSGITQHSLLFLTSLTTASRTVNNLLLLAGSAFFPVAGLYHETSVSVHQERVGDVEIGVGIGLQNKALGHRSKAKGKRTRPTPRQSLTSAF